MGRPFDIELARRETRGCAQRIHFNNAGTALPPIPVADALYDYLHQEELLGGYEVMEEQAEALDHFYQATARLLNSRPDEIAFADSATRAWTAAFYAFDFRPGDRVLVGSSEYGSNLVALLHQAKRRGIEIVPIPDDETGRTDCRALESLIDSRTRMICITQVPSGEGLVNPAAAIGEITRTAAIPYLLDACQSLGQMPVDVESIGCDMLCGTGRKFLRGPRGTGLLYVRRALLEQLEPSQLNHHAAELLSPASYVLRDDAKRFECWERSCAGQVALGIAIDYAMDWGLDVIRDRTQQLATTMRRKLATLDRVKVTDRGGTEKSAIVTFSIDRFPAAELQRQLAAVGINTSVISFPANPLSMTARGLPQLLRASPHYYNTGKEIDLFIEALKNIIEKRNG